MGSQIERMQPIITREQLPSTAIAGGTCDHLGRSGIRDGAERVQDNSQGRCNTSTFHQLGGLLLKDQMTQNDWGLSFQSQEFVGKFYIETKTPVTWQIVYLQEKKKCVISLLSKRIRV